MRLMRVTAALLGFCFIAFASDTGGGVVTPEPSMIALLTAGLAGIGVAAWRRNRKR